MEKRILLALLLMSGVLLLNTWLFPTPQAVVAPRPPAAAAPAPAAPRPGAPAALPAAGSAPEQRVVVRSPLYQYEVSTRGAALRAARLLRYRSYIEPGQAVQLVPPGSADVLTHRVAAGGDTVDLSALPFTASAPRLDLARGSAPRELRLVYGAPGTVGAEIVYTFHADDYVIGVRGRVTGVPGRATLLTSMGPGLEMHDAPEHGSTRELAVVGWNSDAIETLRLAKVEGTEPIAGPLGWVAVKDRYFLMALLSGEGRSFTGASVRHAPGTRALFRRGGGDEPEEVEVPRAHTTVSQPLPADGAFAFQAYVGPQEHRRLVAAGHELEEVNPYGYRWLRPVIRPIAAVVLWAFNQLHGGLGLSYGLVLIVFGVLMRVVTWPLNAKAMRAQMKNMEKQPIMQERMRDIQSRWADDPQRQQKEMMAMYGELGMSPLSMFSGCLPMLIPMPVLITLFFVFQSAIEFRGERFLWLPDLSLKDPLYILPVFLMVSMFALQWVSNKLSGMEETPQTKMMMWFMPLFMGVLFFNFSSGLNLYYAMTNVASLPQQIQIARERRRAAEAKKAEEAAAKKAAHRERRGGTGGPRRTGPRKPRG